MSKWHLSLVEFSFSPKELTFLTDNILVIGFFLPIINKIEFQRQKRVLSL